MVIFDAKTGPAIVDKHYEKNLKFYDIHKKTYDVFKRSEGYLSVHLPREY